MGFVHTFEGKHPEGSFMVGDVMASAGRPRLESGISVAIKTVAAVEAVQELPQANRNVLARMTDLMMRRANQSIGVHDWQENFWGLYIIGSRARGDARPSSDLDLLSVGTFYRDMAFTSGWRGGMLDERLDDGEAIFRGFNGYLPHDLPTEYNVGRFDRKYLVRATAKNPDVRSIDLNVVDLTFDGPTSLDAFKETMDVDEAGLPLVRLPLVELTVVESPLTCRS